ncbi:MAG: division/cell wall cluster transcriptional repressor MraZ [Gammaproteobacteria bacterium]
MFRGISAVNLDAKGRMAVPSRYRVQIEKEANSQLIVTIDTEHRCLLLYPLPEWELIERKIEALPSFNPTARRIQRLLIGHATEVELDNNGRILLPPLLREYAAIDKRVMLVGQGKKFEIWDEGQWQGGRDQWLAQAPLLGTDLPEELKSLSL